MEVLHPRCAGLDVHKDTVVAAVRCYCMLCDGVPYRDLGPDQFARRDKAKTIGHLVRRLRDLGCEVDAKHAA